MKKSTILLLSVVLTIFTFSNVSFAQEMNPRGIRRVYLNTSASLNANGPASVQLNMHLNNQWIGFFSYDEGNPESKNIPLDYKASTGNILGISFVNTPAEDNFKLYTAGIGKEITKHSDKAWVIAKCGISFGQYNENQYTRQPVESYSFFGLFGGTTSNYLTTIEKKSAIGLSAGLEAHANLFRFMAISTGAKLMLTNVGIFPSMNIGMDFGLMRPAKKNMIRAEN